MNFFVKICAALRLREAIKKAVTEHLRTGDRYYVLPCMGSKGRKLIIINRRNFRKLKMKHYIPSNARVSHLLSECFYHTPYGNGYLPIHPKEQARKSRQYFAWVEAERRTE